MAWLRLDDSFAQHPKIGQLTDREFRVWIRLLCWCARYRTPTVNGAAKAEIVGLTAAVIHKLETLRLLERDDNSCHRIHDWNDYNGPDPRAAQAERQRKHRDKNVTRA